MNTSDEIRFSLSEVPRRTTTGTAVGDIGIELAARGSEGDSFSEPYGHENEPAPPPCFKCEYDVKKELYVIREPKVIVPGQDKPIEPEDPGELQKNRTYVCAVTRENNKVKAGIVEEDKVPDGALVSVPICKIDDSRGFDVITQYHVGAIVLGGTTIVGDMDGSEVIGGSGEEILVTGHPGAEDSSGQDSHSGIQFLTVSSREGGGETIPAKLIARIKGKDVNEDWAAHKLTIKGKDGVVTTVHFLGCSDAVINEGGGGGGDGVTSLNGVDGDLVLRLLEGWLEIVKGGQAKKAIGTVVTSVSGLYGDMAVIGGKKIRVDQEGNSLKISYDDEKETEDTNPFPDSPEVCEHPGGGGGAFAGGGGVGGGVQGGGGESGGGDSCCGGASSAGGSATGTPEPGVSGKPATGGSGANGVEITGPQTPEGGKEAGGGLFNGSTIPKKKIEDTNTHGALTDTKKMNTSPFAKDPNWHGSIEDTAGNTKKPIYTGTHNALTDTKKMTESPFKRK